MGVVSVGVDVAKRTFQAASWIGEVGQPLGEFPNSAQGFRELQRAVGRITGRRRLKVRCTLEATAGYELHLAAFAYAVGWSVFMPNPKRVRDWAKGKGRRAKTDSIDALVLAEYGHACCLPQWQPMSAEVGELESLLERQRDLEQLLQQERNRLEASRHKPHVAGAVSQTIEAVIEALERGLKDVEKAINEHVKQHAVLAEARELLLSVPGVGKKNVLWLLVLLNRWRSLAGERAEAKSLVAFVGLDPGVFESGTSIHGRPRISRMGDKWIRRMLYMGTLGAARGNNAVRTSYQRLLARGKAKKVALVATARKVLVWAWTVFKTNQLFDHSRYEQATT